LKIQSAVTKEVGPAKYLQMTADWHKILCDVKNALVLPDFVVMYFQVLMN
jgi:hypothetical protein